MAGGRLITIEGLDGAGKSTLAEGLVPALQERGRAVELLREPGGVALSERIRELVKDPSWSIHPRAEALLYAAARSQLVYERVRPALEQGVFVLLDRFVDSSLAYQGAARELGVEQVRAINLFATGSLVPDRTLLLYISAEQAHARACARAHGLDRLERETAGFFAAVARAYEQLADAEPGRYRVLDASQARERVLAGALDAIEDLL